MRVQGFVIQSKRFPSAIFLGRVGRKGKFLNLCYKKNSNTLVEAFVQVFSISLRIGARVT